MHFQTKNLKTFANKFVFFGDTMAKISTAARIPTCLCLHLSIAIVSLATQLHMVRFVLREFNLHVLAQFGNNRCGLLRISPLIVAEPAIITYYLQIW